MNWKLYMLAYANLPERLFPTSDDIQLEVRMPFIQARSRDAMRRVH